MDGRIQKTDKEVSFDDRRGISSILDFLRERKRFERLKPWWPDLSEQWLEHGYKSVQGMTEAMGFRYVNSYQAQQHGDVERLDVSHSDRNRAVNVDGFKLFAGEYFVGLYRKESSDSDQVIWTLNKDESSDIIAYYKGDLLYVGMPGRGEISFDVKAYALSEIDNNPDR